MKIIKPSPKPDSYFEIRITEKYNFCKTDKRSYLSRGHQTIQVADTTMDELSRVVLDAIQKAEM